MFRHYITTAIDYPNAAPHMGHVLEKVLADVYARWRRLKGDQVRFQIGTDEHGIKIQRTADAQKMSSKELVDANVPLFIDLYTKLGISFDEPFMRTSDQKLHWPTVQELWRKLQAADMLEKRSYTGLYCSGCERFITKKDLIDGLCPDHKIPPEEVTEENYFFLMSRERAWLEKILKDRSYAIVPEFRANETLSLLKEELHDVSFSRPKTSLSWGIPVPGDEAQTMYVWCDALTNYISGLDYFGLDTEARHERSEWWNNATVTHVIGKDIARFHALIWPAMLKAANIKIPDRLLIHGFLTNEGQKMSKSLGNVVRPEEVLAHFNGNPDPLRFYLSHEIPVGNDGDFSWERIDNLYDSKLRKQLGNLLNRVLVLLKKDGEGISLERPSDAYVKDSVEKLGQDEIALALEPSVEEYWKHYEEFFELFSFSNVLQSGPIPLIESANKFIEDQKPWAIEEKYRRVYLLSHVAEILRQIALMLLPFIPETAQKISRQLGVTYAEKMLDKNFTIAPWKAWGADKKWKKIGTPEILFAPLEHES